MTMTGEEKRIVVASPRGIRVKEVKMNAIRKPPEAAMAIRMLIALEIKMSTTLWTNLST